MIRLYDCTSDWNVSYDDSRLHIMSDSGIQNEFAW